MSRTHPGGLRNVRRAALIAAVTAVTLLATDFEATAHRHGGVWAPPGELAAIASPAVADTGWSCAICRLADNNARTAPDPVPVAVSLVRSGDPVPVATPPIRTGPGPVGSPRAPPVSPSC